ncbi:MAG: transcription-repair coupling factor [Candidatus Kapabacteria bacterium]|nr:transcription-repair coupling factor [Candidatus Kapabacteria bacterium]
MKNTINLKTLCSEIAESQTIKQITKLIESGKKEINIKDLSASLRSLTVSALRKKIQRPFVYISPSNYSAEEIFHDINLFSENVKVSILSEPKSTLLDLTETSHDELLWLYDGLPTLVQNIAPIIVTTQEIFRYKIPVPAKFDELRRKVSIGDKISPQDFVLQLALNGFERQDYVSCQGEVSLRGFILDLFPFGRDNPLRIEFWGDEIESIRDFDVLSQRSIHGYTEIEFISGIITNDQGELFCDIYDYLQPNSIIILDSSELIHPEIKAKLKEKYTTITINHVAHADVEIISRTQPEFSGQLRIFGAELMKLDKENCRIILCADGEIHLNRLKELTRNALDINVGTNPDSIEANDLLFEKINWIAEAPSAGFELGLPSLAVLTEHQIFNRVHNQSLRRKKKASSGISLRDLRQLKIGDLVVHEDKGIGRFDGFETVKLGASMQDCVRIIYAEGDILYLHLNYINKIQQYSAQEGVKPILSKLGNTEWLRKKAKTKKRLKDIARDLIKLYAERKQQKGYGFAADSVWQKEFEASFIYEDTIDQAKTSEEVKRDMESQTPMDRLVCGDVGFGKTEIAIRAAFKAVQSGKQVAVLVPTTILADQHYLTFSDRLSRYPVIVDAISRFRTKAEQSEIIKKLGDGKIDILIGTHRLLSKDIVFQDLGLLVIDEEHRFGVGSKEKLRQMRVSVDTLTLTATPIPRTLNFSLMGARDLSTIETAPRNRIPIVTEILPWTNQVLVDAIRSELKRDGQVFFVNDRIDDLEKISADLQMLIPKLRIGIAHGQMPGTTLEKVMEKFLEKKTDVLLTTKIVESGLDIPNANTIIINRAHNFGLAELYQLRGRVGRSNVQAYCYLLIPPVKSIPQKALQRLQAIGEFSELGSGLKLALRDMEIRGAGNLLGPEQSGYINEIGFEMYQKVLDEAVTELRREEFADVFVDTKQMSYFIPENDDIAIDLESDALIPAKYISGDADRYNYYKQLFKLRSTEELNKLSEELKDKYGKFPKELKELIFAVKVRIAALGTGLTKITIRENKFIADFPSEENKEYFDHVFPIISEFIEEYPETRLTQQKQKLSLEMPLDKRDKAVEFLWRIKKMLQSM